MLSYSRPFPNARKIVGAISMNDGRENKMLEGLETVCSYRKYKHTQVDNLLIAISTNMNIKCLILLSTLVLHRKINILYDLCIER